MKLRKLLPLGLGTLLALSLSVPALAAPAEDSAIAVQLNGQPLAFTDAVPQVVDQRTFLPFRAVFEAMGAEVSNDGDVITAVKDGKTLTMTIGSTQAAVSQDGVTVPVAMDVAPYVDNTTWRTYVPVRFAAQAFDCAVGWDQEAMTAVIVDTDKLVDEILAEKQFTYLERLADMSQKYNEGIWDMEMTLDGAMTMMGVNMPMTMSAQGTTADQTQMEMDMTIKVDLSEYMALLTELAQQMGADAADLTGSGLSAEDQAMFDSIKNDGVSMSIRGDISTGKIYMNLSGDLFTAAGMEPDVWYLMDMNELLAQSGMDLDFAGLMKQTQQVDYSALVKAGLAAVDVNSAQTGYTGLKEAVEQAVLALSDQGFVKDGDAYTATLDLKGETPLQVKLTLTMKDDKVTAYTMDLSGSAAAGDSDMTMAITISMDDKDQMNGHMSMTAPLIMGIEMDFTASYAQGSKAPSVEPPAGASILSFNEMAQ